MSKSLYDGIDGPFEREMARRPLPGLAVRVPAVSAQQLSDLYSWTLSAPTGTLIDTHTSRDRLRRVCLDAMEGHLGALEAVEALLRRPEIAAWMARLEQARAEARAEWEIVLPPVPRSGAEWAEGE